MKNRDDIRKEWEEIAPGFDLPRESGYCTPDGYFERFQEEVIREVGLNQPARPASASRLQPIWEQWLNRLLQQLFQPRLAVGLAVLLILVAGWWYLYLPAPATHTALSFQDLESETYQSYVEENIDEFETEMLEEYALQNELPVTGWEAVEDEELEMLLDEYWHELDAEDLQDWL